MGSSTTIDEHDLDLDAPIDLTRMDAELAIDLFARMALIREFETQVNRLFLQGLIPGTIHLSHGQEGCAVGAAAALRIDDWVTITHRGHGQALAKGVSASSMMAELLARDTGCCRGRGGSLHVGDISVGAVPAIAIVGASVPISAGIAFGFRERGEDRVALCFLGDGAMTEGDTHEGLNLAALWELPVVYVCENNLYSVSTRVERQMRGTHLADRAAVYGLVTERVDGNDVIAVHLAVLDAVARARAGGGASFVECLTYRQGGHKRDDPASYRPADEVETWLARDPIVRMRAALVADGRSGDVEAAEARAKVEIDEAVRFARESPLAEAGGA
jgi:acetoin:2,6-dichlorophenolindophenol oxidoreductase subunit alpha